MHPNTNHNSHSQMSESFLTAAFLSLSGGLQDAYTYICRGEVFANAQTGNIVLLSQNICAKNWTLTAHYLIPILAFASGIAAAVRIRQSYQNSRRIHWRQIVLLMEIFLLLLVGFLPSRLNFLANAMVSFSCAMQVQTFRTVNGYPFASTMCIGNIRGGMESLCTYRQTHNVRTLSKAFCYGGIIFLFAVGAGVGGCLLPVLGQYTIWVCCLMLGVSFLLMFVGVGDY